MADTELPLYFDCYPQKITYPRLPRWPVPAAAPFFVGDPLHASKEQEDSITFIDGVACDLYAVWTLHGPDQDPADAPALAMICQDPWYPEMLARQTETWQEIEAGDLSGCEFLTFCSQDKYEQLQQSCKEGTSLHDYLFEQTQKEESYTDEAAFFKSTLWWDIVSFLLESDYFESCPVPVEYWKPLRDVHSLAQLRQALPDPQEVVRSLYFGCQEADQDDFDLLVSYLQEEYFDSIYQTAATVLEENYQTPVRTAVVPFVLEQAVVIRTASVCKPVRIFIKRSEVTDEVEAVFFVQDEDLAIRFFESNEAVFPFSRTR